MTAKKTNSDAIYEKDGRGSFTQRGWLDRERDLARKETIRGWEAKLDGVAFPAMETFITEDEAKEIIIDFILAVTKTRKTVNDKRVGIQIDLAKMAFSTALNVMDELGY